MKTTAKTKILAMLISIVLMVSMIPMGALSVGANTASSTPEGTAITDANGFLTMKAEDRFLIRAGMAVVTVGIVMLALPFSPVFALIGFVVAGLGCAPIYPCTIHMTPDVFGKERSQAMIGVQMAFAYFGFLVMPPLFGVIAEHISVALLPVYQTVLLVMMFVFHERIHKKR